MTKVVEFYLGRCPCGSVFDRAIPQYQDRAVAWKKAHTDVGHFPTVLIYPKKIGPDDPAEPEGDDGVTGVASEGSEDQASVRGDTTGVPDRQREVGASRNRPRAARSGVPKDDGARAPKARRGRKA